MVIAAFAEWHEHHTAARAAMGSRPYLPQHCALETYATLTRLPDPFRVTPETVAEYLRRRFRERRLVPPADELRRLPDRLAALGIIGGAVYDAVVGVTASAAGARLKTLDRRAESVYRALGIDYDVVA